ncbi:hemerythrin family protein [Clostridium bowmanii]|uniref:bacteriohemerythrin n=1 Tax=Clostridium bowmanii TaxID=132925 RepID=UPI001C0C1BA2|nr:hemerythrin family protein [Clostridium bowmanii]MBU3188912.1 hemerythrin family protein [Clostridium bowmanii]MCA1073681.1 hemerythrin family protein [Clostridium bowmanii]
MLKWKDEYLIGVSLIDAQHKKLFELGNSALNLLNNNITLDKYHEIVQIIEDLFQYAKYHFKYEEEYMLKNNYRDYSDQKVEHDGFIKKLDSYNLAKLDQNQDKDIMELILFLFDWILEHILKKDSLIKNL